MDLGGPVVEHRHMDSIRTVVSRRMDSARVEEDTAVHRTDSYYPVELVVYHRDYEYPAELVVHRTG
jgi:hypothetical protein